MSFFKELKEDIVQSVNELGDTIEENADATDIISEPATDSQDSTLEEQLQNEIYSLLENDEKFNKDTPLEEVDGDQIPEEELQDVLEEEEEMEPIVDETDRDEENSTMEDNDMTKETEMNSEAEELVEKENTMETAETNNGDAVGDSNGEETVITQGTTINGGIKSDTSLIVKGVITGDVECKGKITITGKVAGNVKASEVYVNTSRLEGDLISDGSVKIDVGTVVIGSISSKSAVIAGALKGDVEVSGPVVVDSTAIVKGDIKAKAIQINSGAVIDGHCSLQYADVDLDSFFE